MFDDTYLTLEAAYLDAIKGESAPTYVVTPEGAFITGEDGVVRVYGYDAEGNHYELPEEEQNRRKLALKARLEEHA